MPNATFKAVCRSDGTMVAAVAAVPGGRARFFIVQKRETPDLFIGRVTAWVKSQQVEGIQMQPPDVLPEGVETGAVIMQLEHRLGITRREADVAEVDINGANMTWHETLESKDTN